MKSLWKLSAVAVAVMGASLAHADVTPATDAASGSALVLFVRDISAGAAPDRVYARPLEITVDSLLTAAQAAGTYTGPGSPISFTLPTPIGPDSNLSTFLSQGSQFVWTIMAADNVGTAAFSQRYVTTTQLDLTDPTATLPSNSSLRSAWTKVGAMFNPDLNGALPDGGGSTAVNGQWGQSGTAYESAIDWFGGGVNNINPLGQAANLYVLTNSSTQNLGLARVFAAIDVILSATGELSSVSVAAVPLPPALLLLGSAFAGFAGIARRRQNKSEAQPA